MEIIEIQAEIEDQCDTLDGAMEDLSNAESCETLEDLIANLSSAIASMDVALKETKMLLRIAKKQQEKGMMK